ncbi:nucleic acid binding protein, putative [Trypanosoma brucei gambiense DAL972]|uniref:Nucleic acid binding protein, putative n=2 Tax=Trypanosoma brucei TaxID=5691 RepID=D0A7I0_TRYB9|nr:nucleic acid binding protein, putative [Trypanosoma brucei gambiense DAL972]CBH17631.1 nucleic acid binding protein, putative [Trypanosoma brucei gambiense DAL972]|eukprot:XP_011779895.1 nucleic acid binding protein, putative [Trypanosoma brucei gambiense DAL972]
MQEGKSIKPNGLVRCSLHGLLRFSTHCNALPVFDADQVVTGYIYQCKDGGRCMVEDTSADASARRQTPRERAESRSEATPKKLVIDGEPSDTKPVMVSDADGAGSRQQACKSETQRGPSRYYDLATQRAVGPIKKVCWVCGMEGHEKPDCHNSLCKTCHSVRRHHHICQEVQTSPFVTICSGDTRSKEMLAVQCTSCSGFGHFDCSPRLEPSFPSCCFCGEEGHNVFNCESRARTVADPWVNAALALERSGVPSRRRDRGADSTGSYASPSRSWGRHDYRGRGDGRSYPRDGVHNEIVNPYRHHEREYHAGHSGSYHNPPRYASRDGSWRRRENQNDGGSANASYDYRGDRMHESDDRNHSHSHRHYNTNYATEHMPQREYMDSRGSRQRVPVLDCRYQPRSGNSNRTKNYTDDDEYYDKFF